MRRAQPILGPHPRNNGFAVIAGGAAKRRLEGWPRATWFETALRASFDPEKFEDYYGEALVELINAKRSGKTVSAKARPKGDNVVDLMDALKKSIAGEPLTKGKKPKKASAGQKEMLLPIEGKKPAAKKMRDGGLRVNQSIR